MLHYKENFKQYSLFEYENIESKQTDKKVFKFKSGKLVDEETFLKYYTDTNFSVTRQSAFFIIESTDDKLSIKTYYTIHHRKNGKKFFFTEKRMEFITYNFRTKNFYHGNRISSKKKIKSKKINVNRFYNDIILHFNMNVQNILREVNRPTEILFDENHFNKNFADKFMYKFLSLLFDKRGWVMPNYNILDKIIYYFYLKDNEIKYPDNFFSYVSFNFLKKDLKKEKNLVNLTMKTFNYRGKKIRKLLNQLSTFDYRLPYLFNMLGVDYFNLIDERIFSVKNTLTILNDNFHKNKDYFMFLTKKNKKQIVKMINGDIENSHKLLYLIYEHFNMVKTLKDTYNHDFKMNFKDRKSFDDEHYELSKILESYRNGYYKRYNGDEFKFRVEEEIFGMDGVSFFPVLLTNTDEYNNESQVQQNCVRTYVDRKKSIIISLRLGFKDSKERATLEYVYNDNGIERIQSLGKYNRQLKNMYDVPMEILDERINELFKNNIFEPTKIEIDNNVSVKYYSNIFNDYIDDLVFV